MERICKEYIVIKIKERADLGWDEVHDQLFEAPFCQERARIVKLAGNSRQGLDKAVLILVAALAWSDGSYQVVKAAVDRDFVFQIHRKPVRSVRHLPKTFVV
ncbi:hypothetical protein OS493_022003 [Desmophyllum pertusum]|uniref:Uncharacterized protein n=1 Tax=Desmophyllum pertusum TaxID=174260 RepID=A0A9X0CQP8_9CNID|nr:hypothetical protein OS493_022003 [Desmophyllum pertusum]